VAKFRDNLGDHMTRHEMATKAYKLTISLSEKEFRELGLTSWKPIVREAMANLEKEWGRQFQWIASEHMAKGHPHVHIVIKATVWHDTGRYGQLRLDKQHIQDIKKEFGRVIERHRERPKEQERSVERSFADTMLRAVEVALRSLSRLDRDDDEHEIERAHQRWLRQQRSRDDDRGR
jgi:type IV secretory pathway VirD2 relaxase